MRQNLLIIFLFISACAFGQNKLTIIDAVSKEPIPYANIQATGTKTIFFTTSNLRGEADITNLTAYKGEITISCIGYETVTTTIEILKKSDFTISLSIKTLALDQVIVSATRYAQPKSTTPIKITTISKKEVEIQNPQTAADLLNISGEVFIQKSQQGGGSPMIRGFATNRLLITVDGVRMNPAIFRSGNLQNVISIDPFAVKNTEVLFGPNSVIYGSDAIGGVMSFYTLDPQLNISSKSINVSGNAVARYGSANQEKTGHFDINLGWRNLAVVISASQNIFEDLKMGKNGPDEYLRPFYVRTENNQDFVVQNSDPRVQTPSGYNQTNLMAKVLFKLNPLWDFTYGFHYSATTEYDRYDRLLVMNDTVPASAEWKYGPQKWMMNNLKIHNIANNDLFDEFTLRLAHQQFEESRIDRKYQNTSRRTRVEEVLALSLNADFVKSIGNKNTFFYGAEFVFNDVNSTGIKQDITTGFKEPTSDRYPVSQWYSYAAYVTYQRKLNQQLLLHVGSRYNRFLLNADFSNNKDYYPLPEEQSTINNGALTGSLGLDFNPANNWSISANVSTGFRSPNVDDIGKTFDSEPGNVVVPNPDLKAEYAYNAEIDVAKIFGNFLKIDVAVFYTYLQDAMVRRNSTFNGADSILYDGVLSQVQSVQNAAKAYVYGAEAGIKINLPANFIFSSQFNFQRGYEELDNGDLVALRHAAPQFGLSKISYKYKNLTAEFYATYSGKLRYEQMPPSEINKDYLYVLDENENPYSPSWYTLNVKIQYKITRFVTVNGGVENLTNQRYRPYSSGLVAPGLNVIFAVRASF